MSVKGGTAQLKKVTPDWNLCSLYY